jgi:hypothetical protein
MSEITRLVDAEISSDPEFMFDIEKSNDFSRSVERSPDHDSVIILETESE